MFITTTFSTLGLVGVFLKIVRCLLYIFDTWAGRCPFLDHIFSVEQENQSQLFTRSLLSVLEKVCLGAERMVLRMWTQKLVNPLVNVGDVAPS